MSFGQQQYFPHLEFVYDKKGKEGGRWKEPGVTKGSEFWGGEPNSTGILNGCFQKGFKKETKERKFF